MVHEVDGKHKRNEMQQTSCRKHKKDWFKERRCGRLV